MNDDGTKDDPLRHQTAPLGNAILVLGIGVLGLVMAHHPMLFSGFRRIQTDLRDTRLIHYLLEHGYLWVRGFRSTARFGIRRSFTRSLMLRHTPTYFSAWALCTGSGEPGELRRIWPLLVG